MKSNVEFYDVEDMAKFVAVIATTTSLVFEVKPFGNNGYRVTFTGGM